MSIDRSTILIGPGKIVHDGATYFSSAPIALTVSKTFAEIRADSFGVVLRSLTDVSIELTATPMEWGNHSKMNPYLGMAMGTLINGGTDKPLVVTPVNGQPLTLAAAAVMRPPGLDLSAQRPMLGAMTWTGVLANNTAWSAAGARLSHGAAASGVALTGFDKDKTALCTWSPAYGATALPTEDGVKVDWNVQLDPVSTDSDGIVDYSFGGLEAVAKLTPLGMSAQAYLSLLAVQGAGIVRGSTAAVADLVVTGGALDRVFTLKNCTPRVGNERHGRAVKRLGELEFVATRNFADGVLSPIAVFA